MKLCAVVKAELSYGASLSAHKAANLRAVEAFCAPFVSLPFDDACAQTYGVLRAQLPAMSESPEDLVRQLRDDERY